MAKLSDHFDGHKYYNLNPNIAPHSLWRVLLWRWKRKIKPWPYIQIEQTQVEQKRTQIGEYGVTFINHSTVLIQLERWNILTDPIWSKRAGPFSWFGFKRVIVPGVKFKDLPPIDMVLISHNHYDHMDIPTLKRLDDEHQPIFFVPKGNYVYLRKKRIKSQIIELDWWESVDFDVGYKLYFVPSQHYSARGIWDRNRTLWGGFVVKSPKYMIYFAGDTGFGPHFNEIHKRLGSPSLSLLPIGAFEPRKIMHKVHLSPQEAVEAHLILNSKQSLAIHFGTFQLADEDIQSPIIELQRSLKAHDLPINCFWILEPGESRKVY